MGASERSRRELPEPRPVWVVWEWSTGPRHRRPGILLEWRKVDCAGRPPRWEGLVCMASGGGERAWSVELRWILASELRPIGRAHEA